MMLQLAIDLIWEQGSHLGPIRWHWSMHQSIYIYAPSKKRSLGVEDLDLYLSQPLSNVDGGRYHCSVTVSFCSLSSVTAV